MTRVSEGGGGNNAGGKDGDDIDLKEIKMFRLRRSKRERDVTTAFCLCVSFSQASSAKT